MTNRALLRGAAALHWIIAVGFGVFCFPAIWNLLIGRGIPILRPPRPERPVTSTQILTCYKEKPEEAKETLSWNKNPCSRPRNGQ